MDRNLVVHFGAGALGSGLVMPLLQESGKAIVLVDTNDNLINRIKKTKTYDVKITNDLKEMQIQTISVLDALSTNHEQEAIRRYLKQAQTITTSVRRENLASIAKTIASGWKNYDCIGRQVICCENVENVGTYFKELLLDQAETEKERINLGKISVPNTMVDRICATVDGEITSEVFYECSVDKAVLDDTGIAYISSVDNLEGHFYRKRYLLNSYADAISFIALAKGYTYLYEAASSEEINAMVRPYLGLLVDLLEIQYGIDQKESQAWIEKYQQRLSNPNIPRELKTVARDLWLKLNPKERFIQPLIQLKQHGKDIEIGIDFITVLIDAESEIERNTLEEILENLQELPKNDMIFGMCIQDVEALYKARKV